MNQFPYLPWIKDDRKDKFHNNKNDIREVSISKTQLVLIENMAKWLNYTSRTKCNGTKHSAPATLPSGHDYKITAVKLNDSNQI